MNKDAYIRVLENALKQYENADNWQVDYSYKDRVYFIPEKGCFPGAVARAALAVHNDWVREY